jgi:hypothetical protein
MTLQLPPVLEPARGALEAALAVPTFDEWPEDAKYVIADQPAAIARALVKHLPAHAHLRDDHSEYYSPQVAYLFRETIAGKLAVASRAPGKLHFFADLDFGIDFAWEDWQHLLPEQKIALVDHELCHCVFDDGKPAMRKHDVEEFGEIVQRWGLWRPDLAQFSQAFPKEAR